MVNEKLVTTSRLREDRRAEADRCYANNHQPFRHKPENDTDQGFGNVG